MVVSAWVTYGHSKGVLRGSEAGAKENLNPSTPTSSPQPFRDGWCFSINLVEEFFISLYLGRFTFASNLKFGGGAMGLHIVGLTLLRLFQFFFCLMDISCQLGGFGVE